ncbi:iron uptake porin [Aphanothece sacrum]|uniref:S-layer OprB family carbohydrate-selective porin n=1 Tax=Aphanothece sacrum FPU1 TaxID=1920663 RepID=A0A401IM49_APHSA|nr:iron uptake porin [Aphanothece sacrum]GBF82340.1 S-layer OprB family carbohydrate-selective porin [Aphanothece sacrum FPU1]GBF84240.1 S-layer OprB family carbohydrate-selective porin [Aphanothece sacrum FPU3]
MLKLLWKSLLVTPAFLGVALTISSAATAVESKTQAQTPEKATAGFEIAQLKDDQLINQLENYGEEGVTNSNDQVTSVSELRDVSPTDWAYEALRSLVERYGCIVGYPDRTFRGNRATSRWEFAAGLNACLNTMERLIQENVAVLREDIEKLKRLMQEFEAELAALGARVDNLEGRVAFLEDHQFSTTTKLVGEVIFAATASGGSRSSEDNQAVLQDRVRLSFNTSFSGEDLLVTRLTASTGQGQDRFTLTKPNLEVINPNTGQPIGIAFAENTLVNPTATQTFNIGPRRNESDNDVVIDWVGYYAPIRIYDNFKLDTYVAAWGGKWYDFVPTLNPYFEDFDGGKGSLGTFAQRNPIYRIGGGAGAGGSFQLGFLQSILGPSSISFGYLAGTANDPCLNGSGENVNGSIRGCQTGNAINPATGRQYEESDGGNGLFNGNYGVLAQFNTNLFNTVNVAFTYVNAYHKPDSPIFGEGAPTGPGSVGTSFANFSRSQLNNAFAGGSVGAPGTPTQEYNTNGRNARGQGAPGGLQGGLEVNPFDIGGKVTNSYGGALTWKIADWVNFSAFGSYHNVRFIGRGLSGEIWTGGGGLAFPDLFKEGNLLGIFAGVQPYLGDGRRPTTTQFTHFTSQNPVTVEMFYRYQVTDNISITPGVVWISKPDQFVNLQGSDSEILGTVRGTFSF